MIGWGWNVPVGVQGTGWKGVGVGEALGAAVTRTKGRAGAAGAAVPHPARSNPARKVRWINFLILYCDEGGLVGVFAAVGIEVEVAVGNEVEVAVGMEVAVAVGSSVAVGISVGVEVAVGKFGITVTPGTGVRVGMFGTQSLCPA